MKASDVLERLPKRVMSAVSLVAAASLGATAGMFLRNATSAHFNPLLHTGIYSFSGSDCMDSVDPVTVRFNGTDASAKKVQMHADHHGVLGPGVFPEAWDSHGSALSFGGGQYFWDHDGCEPQDRESASNNGFLETIAQPRYHMRYNEGDIGGVLDFDPAVGGYYTLATAHHDNVDFCEKWINLPPPLPPIKYYWPTHVIDSGTPSGFDLGRNRLETLWVTYGDHFGPSIKDYWGNIDLQRQCNGDEVRSDGYVLYVDIDQEGGSVGGKAFLGF